MSIPNPSSQQPSVADLIARAQENIKRAEELFREANALAEQGRRIRLDNAVFSPEIFTTVPIPNEERDAPTMRSRDKDALSLWVDDLRHPLNTRPSRRSRGINADRSSILHHRRVVAVVVGEPQKRPVIALTLKRWPRLGVSNHIMKLAAAHGVPYLVLPNAVSVEAKINQETIEVVDIGRPVSLLAAPDVLFHAVIPLPRDEWHQDGAHADWVQSRSAYFISGFDANELVPKWFLCELPPEAKPNTVAEGYATLKPGAVATAEELGYKVKRQGDMYAIPMKTPPEGIDRNAPRGFLFRSNHRADQIAYVGDEVYARGKIVHRPLDRPADHKPLRLGRRWHKIVKNTVPVVK